MVSSKDIRVNLHLEDSDTWTLGTPQPDAG